MADDVQITVGVALDNLNRGVQQATSKISEMKAALVELTALGGLTALVMMLSDLGEQAERAAAILGVSTEAAQELGIIAQVTGGSLEGITTQLTRLQVGLERGEKATSIQAAALKALGISAQQFLSTPVNKQVDLFADAVKRLSDQGKNAAPALALISRGLAQMMPELVLGSAGMNELRQRAIDMGAVVSGPTTQAMAQLHTQLILLWDGMKGLGQTLLAAVSPALIQFAKEAGDAFVKLAALVATSTLLSTQWEEFKLRAERVAQTLTLNSAGVADVDRRLAALNGRIAETVQHYKDLLAAAADAGEKTALQVKIPGADANAMKIAEENFKTAQRMIQGLVDTYQIGEQTKTQMLLAQVAVREKAEIKAGETIAVAQAKAGAEIAKINQENTRRIVDEWKSAADTIASSFNSQLRGMLSGTTTFAQAMKNMVGDLIIAVISSFVKMAAEWAATQLAMLVVGRASLGVQFAEFTSKLTADAALVFGGVFANLAPIMGPAAAGPATTSQALVLAQLANVPKFAVGIDYVPQDMLAMVHQGEKITPAEQNTRDGGGNVSLHVSAVDAKSVANMFFNNRAFMSQLLNLLARNNPSSASRLAGMV